MKKAETSFESLEDAGDLTFGEVLDAEEISDKIDGEYILNEFAKWKTIIFDLDKYIDELGAKKKKLKEDSENEDLKVELEDLYNKLHFNEKDL